MCVVCVRQLDGCLKCVSRSTTLAHIYAQIFNINEISTWCSYVAFMKLPFAANDSGRASRAPWNRWLSSTFRKQHHRKRLGWAKMCTWIKLVAESFAQIALTHREEGNDPTFMAGFEVRTQTHAQLLAWAGLRAHILICNRISCAR